MGILVMSKQYFLKDSVSITPKMNFKRAKNSILEKDSKIYASDKMQWEFGCEDEIGLEISSYKDLSAYHSG